MKRNIKRVKEVLQKKVDLIKARERRELEKEKEKLGPGGRNSDFDSNSIKDTDAQSMVSFSALGAYGAQKIDIKKVALINQNVQNMVACRTPFETMLQVVKTFKQAFKNVARCTIFVLNRYLQAYVFKDMAEKKRHFKAIQMGGRYSIVYAIFQDAKEYCKPTFSSM